MISSNFGLKLKGLFSLRNLTVFPFYKYTSRILIMNYLFNVKYLLRDYKLEAIV